MYFARKVRKYESTCTNKTCALWDVWNDMANPWESREGNGEDF